jgi:hypothetical protein
MKSDNPPLEKPNNLLIAGTAWPTIGPTKTINSSVYSSLFDLGSR